MFAAFEQDDGETISCTIFDSNNDLIPLTAVACFMRRELTRVKGYSLIKKLNTKRFLKHIIKVNDVSALRYAIIKLKSEEYKV